MSLNVVALCVKLPSRFGHTWALNTSKSGKYTYISSGNAQDGRQKTTCVSGKNNNVKPPRWNTCEMSIHINACNGFWSTGTRVWASGFLILSRLQLRAIFSEQITVFIMRTNTRFDYSTCRVYVAGHHRPESSQNLSSILGDFTQALQRLHGSFMLFILSQGEQTTSSFIPPPTSHIPHNQAISLK